MLAKKNTRIIKYASLIIIMMLVLAEYAFAKEGGKSKGNRSRSSQKSSQRQKSDTQRTKSSSRPVSKSSSASSRTSPATRQSNIGRSNVATNTSTKTANVNRGSVRTNRTTMPSQTSIRSSNRSTVRTNRSVTTRTPASTNITTHSVTSRPRVSVKRSTPTVTRSTVRNPSTSIRTQQSKIRNTNISVSRGNRATTTTNRSIATKIGRANVSVSRRNTGTQQSKNTVSSNRAAKIGSNIGRSVGTVRSSVIAKSKGTQQSRTNVGRDTVKKSRIGGMIGDRRRTVVERRNERSSSDLTVQRRQRNVESSIVKKPVTDRRTAVRADRDESSLTRQKSTLRTRTGAGEDRLIRDNSSRGTRARVDSEHRSGRQLEQRRDRKGIVVKNLKYRRGRKSDRVVYQDRPYSIRHMNHTEHVYRDYYGSLCHRIIWPRFRFWVSYRWGGNRSFCHVYPYYHRKYVFVSLGGYWPIGYRYVRYYWYPWHIYRWYGYYPVAREIYSGGDNYYTYNYYNYYGSSSSDIPYVDETTFADVRAKLAQQGSQEPAEATLADKYFEEAVKAFELGSYGYAADKFAEAKELAPDDIILPFAYVQALFAAESYPEAAEALREALEKISPEKEGVFYPRGLYSNEEVLFEQIDKLSEKAKLYTFDADLQLLLGYQLLGVGDNDEAEEHLLRASEDMTNAPSAMILLELLARIGQQEMEENEIIEQEPAL